MRIHTLAHLSDLHLGVSPAAERSATALCRTLLAARIDHVVVSGDITHRGRRDEYARFEQVFHPLLRTGRMTVVPGNHDRLGEDVRLDITAGMRVTRSEAEGLCIVRVDSTAPHNRTWLASHGDVSADELDHIDALLDDAPSDALKVVTLHHHPLPLPEDTLSERLATRLGSANGAELPLGPQLIKRLCGRCDLLLHGHRHVPREITLFRNERPRPLRIVNAGSSTELGLMRVFPHQRGRITADPYWISAQLDRVSASRPKNSLGLWNAVRAIGLF
jgi:3',5'-cyclic AMP phosphodiesterase CpdA